MVAAPDWKTLADACRMEHHILEHVKDALRVTLEWDAPDVGLSRKLSSVRFTLKSFQRHLERLMDLEENGGYLVVVAEYKPNLHQRAVALRAEHDAFRSGLAEVVVSIDGVGEEDGHRVAEVFDDVAALLARIDEHDRLEINLIQEAIILDEGGEG